MYRTWRSFQMTLTKLDKNFVVAFQACRAAALKTKTFSGVKRFQESKDYGQWFNKLTQYQRWIAVSVNKQSSQVLL